MKLTKKTDRAIFIKNIKDFGKNLDRRKEKEYSQRMKGYWKTRKNLHYNIHI